MNIPKYIDLFRNDLVLKNYSQNTIKNYVNQIDCFLKHHEDAFTEPCKINEKSIADITVILTIAEANPEKV